MITELIMIAGAVVFIFISGCLFVYAYQSKKMSEITAKYRNLKKFLAESDDKISSEIQANRSPEYVFNCTYESIIKKTESNPSSRLTVISDELGLPVASSSKQCQELATASVLFLECEEKLRRNIAFENLNRIDFFNKSNQSLTVFPMIVNNQAVYFSSIAQGIPDYNFLFAEKTHNKKAVC